jgi:hypothetical protein
MLNFAFDHGASLENLREAPGCLYVWLWLLRHAFFSWRLSIAPARGPCEGTVKPPALELPHDDFWRARFD